ncbi:MAG: NTP transferase domain-containing protein, partial [Xanthomonadales bacterium]|nr:NTP transferase domain-containing protein [Xanthomonadales bacterium]NIX13543.1 NTP transferase domain-containing protein [Xanthomonadales bacterium]
MAEPRLACLLPAAGGSERLGRPKQLLELDGEALVVRSARLLLEQSDEVTVVTGACAGQVGDALRELPVGLVHNRGWESGMGGSIAAGVRAIGDGPDGILIMLCDQWRITAGDLGRLVGA